jgi:hypothetical protein
MEHVRREHVDQERELHEVNGCLELLFTLRSEFAQWLGEAQQHRGPAVRRKAAETYRPRLFATRSAC